MKIILTSQGDNKWIEAFDSEEKAYWFLYGILSKKERYSENESEDIGFDCEDDMITWEQDGIKKYCAGWHWSEYAEKDQIIMPDGHNLYELMSKIENE